MDTKTKFLIIGAGTFGLSTALELLAKGETDVTLLDAFDLPSPISAGNDVNKIFQSSLSDEEDLRLAFEALEMWRRHPVYRKAFHETGIVYAAKDEEERNDIDNRRKLLERNGQIVQKLTEPEDFFKAIYKKDSPKVSDGMFKDWYGYFQKNECGWLFARLAMELVGHECMKNGVKYVKDEAQVLLMNNLNDCIGARTVSGRSIEAGTTILCAGANSFKFLDFKNQLLAKCWTLGHIKLTDEEAAEYRNMPVVLNLDGGFVFEPDCNNELKFCNEFPGYTNFVHRDSTPVYREEIPVEAEIQMRQFLKQVFPQFEKRPFSVAKICWCTDTPDRRFLIGEHPCHKNLVLGTGDSGKSFKYMPIMGKYIGGIALFGSEFLSETQRNNWGWRPQKAKSRNLKDTQGRFGGTNQIKDLGEIKHWSRGLH